MEALITNPEKPFAESGIAEDVSPPTETTSRSLCVEAMWVGAGTNSRIISIAEAENGTLRLTMPFGEKICYMSSSGRLHVLLCGCLAGGADSCLYCPGWKLWCAPCLSGWLTITFRGRSVPKAIGVILQLAAPFADDAVVDHIACGRLIKMLRGKSSFSNTELLLPVAGAVFGLRESSDAVRLVLDL